VYWGINKISFYANIVNFSVQSVQSWVIPDSCGDALNIVQLEDPTEEYDPVYRAFTLRFLILTLQTIHPFIYIVFQCLDAEGFAFKLFSSFHNLSLSQPLRPRVIERLSC